MILSSLVEHVLAEYADRPEDAVGMYAGRALFDFETCAAAGRGAVSDAFADDAAAAAAAAHALDRDDVHWPSVTHAGAIVWPVVLSAGSAADATGATAVRAAAVGYEVTARLANILGSGHRQHWHATTTAGTVGAAAAAAVAFGLDESRTAAAAAHAACVAGGISQTLLERSGTRLFYRAHAVLTGLAAARAAGGGLDATRLALDGPKGLFAAAAPGAAPDDALGGWPAWAIEELWLRVHAATGFAHTAIDAAAHLGPVDRSAVRSIEIVAPPAAVAMAGNLAPVSRDDGWWSIPYCVAVALVHGDAAAIATPDIVDVTDLLARTTIVPGEDDLAATVTVDGRSATVEFPTGHPKRPLDDEQLVAKWSVLGVGSDDAGRALLELTQRLPELSVREYLGARPTVAAPLSRA